MSVKGWIGIDLDGTLAHYDGWKGPAHIGAPIPLMVERVKAWLAEGREVRVFTARVSSDGSNARVAEAMESARAIEAWCKEHIGCVLTVTNIKDYAMISLYDDRAVQVETNTGRIIGNV
jgi:hypothetical protein